MKLLQTKLINLGYDVGQIDGILGAKLEDPYKRYKDSKTCRCMANYRVAGNIVDLGN